MSAPEESSIRDKIADCLGQQLNELDLLMSMYPDPDNIVLTDKNILEDIKKFTELKSELIPNHLDFVINLSTNGLKLELCVNLPSLYPTQEPDIYVRCNQLNRQQETLLNSKLSNFVNSSFLHEVFLYSAISWLLENINDFIDTTKFVVETEDDSTNTSKEDNFVRYWIYSHHIYNKKKREDILKLAKDLDLTGFCLPGKPGVICIEGSSSSCKEWWKIIKSMCWKKIVLRKIDSFDSSVQKQMQKFKTFEEVHCASSATRNNSKHADMTVFAKYMEEHGLTKEFNEFFGL